MMIVSDDAEALALDGKENFEFKPKEEKNNNAEGTKAHCAPMNSKD